MDKLNSILLLHRADVKMGKSAKPISAITAIIIAAAIAILMLSLIYSAKIRPTITGGSVVTTTAEITGLAYEYYCNISLQEGWNLVSEPCIVANKSITSVLSSVNGSYDSVHHYNGTAATDKWKAYNPRLPEWVVQDLNEISVQSGYWINMNSDSKLTINGTIMTIHFISLSKGWNMAGYPINKTKNVTAAFSILSSGQINRLYAYNSTTGAYEVYYMNNNTGSLLYITPGRGYWVNVTSAGTWTVTE